jgi:hypothetical protein
MSDERNAQLIRNLMGRRVDHHVVSLVEEAYSGEMKLPDLAERLFVVAGFNFTRTTDVIFWIARVLPDDAAAWAKALMAEYKKIGNRNPAYVHAMLIGLFQISVALNAIPSSSSEDGRAFQDKLSDWFAYLLVDGKIIALDPAYENALSKALDRYLRDDDLATYVICDAMAKFVSAADRYFWKSKSISEYVIRRAATGLMERLLKADEVARLLAKYRESQRYHLSSNRTPLPDGRN